MSRRKESHTDQEALLFKNTMQISRQQENLEEKPSFTSVWKLTVRIKISKKCNYFRKAAYFVALKKFKKSTLLGGIRPNHSADFSWFLLISVDLSWFQADFSFSKMFILFFYKKSFMQPPLHAFILHYFSISEAALWEDLPLLRMFIIVMKTVS